MGEITNEAIFTDATAFWNMAEIGDFFVQGNVKIAEELKGIELTDSIKHTGNGKTATFTGDGWLYLEKAKSKEFHPSDKMSFCIRAKVSKPGTLIFTNYFSLSIANQGLVIAFLGLKTSEGKIFREIPLAIVTENEWHDFIVRFDTGKLEFFCDGILLNTVEIKEKPCEPFSCPLKIGARWNGLWWDGTKQYEVTGQIDHVILWNIAITDRQIALLSAVDKIEKLQNKSESDKCIKAYNDFHDASIAKDIETCKRLSLDMRKIMNRDPYRPQYHLTAPMGWMFDPVGAFYYKGKYHIYTNRNIYAILQFNCLDHYVSDDMIHWEQMPIPLWADSDLDIFGIWLANHFIDDDGIPNTIYTAQGTERKFGVRAKSRDELVSFGEKHPAIPDHHDGHTWKDGDKWYSLTTRQFVGKRPGDLGDTIVIYSSSDLNSWKEEGEIFTRKKQPEAEDIRQKGGFMEFPYLLPFGDKHVLMSGMCPVLYWVGKFDKEKFVFTPDEPKGKLLDHLNWFHCFNPMIVDNKTVDGTDRRIVFAMKHDIKGFSQKLPWNGVLTLPRTICRQGDRLIQKPAKEIELLHSSHHHQKNISITPDSKNLIQHKGDMLDIIAEFETENAKILGLKVRISEDGQEFVRIFYDTSPDTFTIDGSIEESIFKEQGIGKAYLKTGESVIMRVLLDKAFFEFFINGNTCTGIFNASKDSMGLDLFSEGGTATCKNLDIWEMKPVWQTE